jgi:hypothetical protein
MWFNDLSCQPAENTSVTFCMPEQLVKVGASSSDWEKGNDRELTVREQEIN